MKRIKRKTLYKYFKNRIQFIKRDLLTRSITILDSTLNEKERDRMVNEWLDHVINLDSEYQPDNNIEVMLHEDTNIYLSELIHDLIDGRLTVIR